MAEAYLDSEKILILFQNQIFFKLNLVKFIIVISGVRLAQELLQSMESIVSSELSEIRRCTAELSSRYRLKVKHKDSSEEATTPSFLTPAAGVTAGGPPYRKVKHMSQFYVLPDKQCIVPPTCGAVSILYCRGGDGERCHSEPPFSGDEGLYRAQSCPGLPQPLLETCEGRETVAELRPSVLRLRTDKTPLARDKLLNR